MAVKLLKLVLKLNDGISQQTIESLGLEDVELINLDLLNIVSLRFNAEMSCSLSSTWVSR